MRSGRTFLLLLWGHRKDHNADRGGEAKAAERLKRIEGQVRGLQAMIERDAYCYDILTQSAAVNAAMNAFNKEILAHHIEGCVARDIREGKDEVIDELVTILQKLMK
jgi:DNA-binding FrmR family transcriptional regulator